MLTCNTNWRCCYGKVILGLIVLFLLIRYAGALRLTVPLLYAFLVPTIFHEWYYAHQPLAEGIWFGMLALVVLSWIVTIVRRMRELF